jgi:hypothetical protein
MNKLLNIITSIDQPDFLLDLVERLATRRYDIGFSHELMPAGWKAIDTSSVETFVSGATEFRTDGFETAVIPFTTGFLFTCAHEKNDPYKVNWCASLS